jgi:hypothetical protein
MVSLQTRPRTLLGGLALFEGPEPFNLEQRTNDELRRFFLDGMRLPPLLPSIHKCEELIADHHLTCTAVTNVLLRTQGITGEQFLHEFRLGVLLHELSDEEPLKTWMKQFSRAWQTARFLCGHGVPPDCMDTALLQAVHEAKDADALKMTNVFIVAAGAQRIKQFVFESPGLNEIRGASTQLDDCIKDLQKQVGDELGPEVVFRAAASTLEFLAPLETDSKGRKWVERLKEHFYMRTGSAFIAAASQVEPHLSYSHSFIKPSGGFMRLK